jgi:hypothetical protein
MLNTRRSFFKALGFGVLASLGAAWPLKAWGCWRRRGEPYCVTFPLEATYASIAGPSPNDQIAGGGGACVWGETDGLLRADATPAGASSATAGTVALTYLTFPDPISPCNYCFWFRIPGSVGKKVTVNIYALSGSKPLNSVTFTMLPLPPKAPKEKAN